MSASNTPRAPRAPRTPARDGPGPKPVWGRIAHPTTMSPEEYEALCGEVLAHPVFASFSPELMAIISSFIRSDTGRGYFLNGTLKNGTMKWGVYSPGDYQVRRFSPHQDNDKNGDTSVCHLLSVFVLMTTNPSVWDTVKSHAPHGITYWGDLTTVIETYIFPLVREGNFRFACALTTLFPIVLGASRLGSEVNIAECLASGSFKFLKDEVSYVRLAWTIHTQMTEHFFDRSISSLNSVRSIETALSDLRAFHASLATHRSDGSVPNIEQLRRQYHSIAKRVDDASSIVETVVRFIPTVEVLANRTHAIAHREEFTHLACLTLSLIDSLAPPKPVVATPKVLPFECSTCKKRFDVEFKMAQHRQSVHSIPMPEGLRKAQGTASRGVVPSLNHAMIVEEGNLDA